ncbi:calpain-like cysteine peptidase [Trypanosoma conorhini]|uniref:Calpain-like cysteine peptidase n=1 Tax=Trypanosoma conorhini TaxID=83891 RepID=A0A422QC38_9TRYP|nr:calpain-like cysteine peptidase [Trypanosoma conorhini]RNF27495.1 calpain-like cysteine peptidase [Trypanosoma conorhini]
MHNTSAPADPVVEAFSDMLRDCVRPVSALLLEELRGAPNVPVEGERQSLREIYAYSCGQHHVRPNADVLRQLPPSLGADWVTEVKVLDFSLAYLGRGGCAALVPVIGVCTSMTHLVMPSVGLTEEAAWPLLLMLQAHPSLMWIDLSGNPLNDNVGRWILSMVLENPNIQFLLLRDTGISLPLVLKITHQLQHRKQATTDVSILFKQTLDLERLSFSAAASLSVSASTPDAPRGRRIPASVAAGLAELRHRLHRNRHCIQKVYECFILPKCDADGSENTWVEPSVDIVTINGEWDTVSISEMMTGRCSWRAFFRGLRLLGIHAVSRTLTESVTFATICGICNLETIYFGRLLSFLRPHVALRMATPLRANISMNSHLLLATMDESPLVCETPGCEVAPPQRPTSVSGACSLSITHFSVRPEPEKSACASSLAEPLIRKSSDPANVALVVKPRDSIRLGGKPSPVRVASCTSPTLNNTRTPSSLATPDMPVVSLEEEFRLECFFHNRKTQHVLDRLYDARKTLRESFQTSVSNDVVAPLMVRIDDVIEQAVAFLGEAYREGVMALLKPWRGEEEECAMLPLEKWLNSMYVPEARGSNLPPFSLSEERRMWRSVDVERLQNVLRAC